MALSTRHLLGIKDLAPSDISLLLDTAKQFKEVLNRPVKKVPSLRDVTVVNLFYENSTRTRISFNANKTWRDYNSSTLFAGAPISGNDNMLSLGANASYDATRRLRFNLGAGYDERTSSIRLFKYHAKRVNFTTSLAL